MKFLNALKQKKDQREEEGKKMKNNYKDYDDAYFIRWNDGVNAGFVDYNDDFVRDDMEQKAKYFTKKEAEKYVKDYEEKYPAGSKLSIENMVDYKKVSRDYHWYQYKSQDVVLTGVVNTAEKGLKWESENEEFRGIKPVAETDGMMAFSIQELEKEGREIDEHKVRLAYDDDYVSYTGPCNIDIRTIKNFENEQRELTEFVTEFTYRYLDRKERLKLTQEDIENCRKVIPGQQLALTMELCGGEEGDFFLEKMKDISETVMKITTDHELTNEDGTHDAGLHYFMGSNDIYVTELYGDGYGFGYVILKGDLQMSEWGDISIDEIKDIKYMEMDYHVKEGITVEEMLHEKYPDYFKEVKRGSDESFVGEGIKNYETAGEKAIKEAGNECFLEHKLTYKLSEEEQRTVKNEAVKSAENISENRNVNQKERTNGLKR